jgi:hypothetical protein
VKRAALLGVALACLALAAFLALLAVDVSRSRAALRSGDVRYRATPGVGDLWNPAAVLPPGVARRLLEVEDDVAYRRAVRELRLADLENGTISDPKLVLHRAEAQTRLEAIARGGGDPVQRSRATSLLGVLALATPAATPQERATVLRSAVATLQEAIALDPDNDEAKYNLEVALRRSRGVQTVQGGPTSNPTAGGTGGKGAATGPPGSGY